MAIISVVSYNSQQSPRPASKKPKMKYFLVCLLQLASAVVKSNFYPSSAISFSTTYMDDTLFQSTLFLYLYTFPLVILCVCCHHHASFYSRPKIFRFSPCLRQLTLFHLELSGERLSHQTGKGGPISWHLISSHWEAASKRQQKGKAEQFVTVPVFLGCCSSSNKY